MSIVLRIDGQQIGELVVKVESANTAHTPLGVQVGLWQPTGRINAESTNLMYRQRVTLKCKQATNVLASKEISDIQVLVNRLVDMEIRVDGTPVMQWDDCYVESVSDPELYTGAGGRFTDQLVVTFVGERSPVWAVP